MNSFRVVRSQPEMADDLARIQKLCFPTVGKPKSLPMLQYRSHIATFPEGQLAVIDKQGTVVVGSTSCRCNLDLANYHHTYMEASGDNWFKTMFPTVHGCTESTSEFIQTTAVRGLSKLPMMRANACLCARSARNPRRRHAS